MGLDYGAHMRRQAEIRKREFALLSDAERKVAWEARKAWLWGPHPLMNITWEAVSSCPACEPNSRIAVHRWPSWCHCACGAQIIVDRWLPDDIERVTMRVPLAL